MNAELIIIYSIQQDEMHDTTYMIHTLTKGTEEV